MVSPDTFMAFIRNNNLCSQQHRLLLAVSGGADSMAMCNLFLANGFTFGITHCNFKLRGEQSDNDAEFVHRFAERNGLPYFERSFDTISHSKAIKVSIEEAARNLRYAFFNEICATHQYDKIVTGHHQNDNAETILLRLAKGTGLLGLKGIPLSNANIIRPLLFASKKEIEIYCAENKIEYLIDSSNLENVYQRNKIRNEVIPVLEAINPAFISTMDQNINHFSGAYTFYKHAVEKQLHKIVQIKGTNKYIPIAALGDAARANILLFELLHPLEFNSTQISQIIKSFGNSGKVFYSNEYRVLIDRKFLILCAKADEKNTLQLITPTTKKLDVGNFQLAFETGKYSAGISFNANGTIAYFDAGLIEYPLFIRRWKSGDYLYPLGLTKRNSEKTGKKKVSDLLVNAKIDALAKENTFVLISGEKIIWVVGIRQDDRLKVTEKTTQLLKIKMLP